MGIPLCAYASAAGLLKWVIVKRSTPLRKQQAVLPQPFSGWFNQRAMAA